MLWLPFVRRMDATWIRVLLAATVGLLGFLAVDATLEALEIAGEGAQALGGAGLVALGAALAYLALAAVSAASLAQAKAGAAGASPLRMAGSSRSASACTTSARASRSARPTPPARSPSAPSSSSASRSTTRPRASPSWLRSAAAARAPPSAAWRRSGCWPAAPPVIGAWIGAAAFTPSLAAFLLGVGVGAIAQVIVQIAPGLRNAAGRDLDGAVAGGIAGGMLAMYATGLLVARDGVARRHQRRRRELREGDLRIEQRDGTVTTTRSPIASASRPRPRRGW